MAAGRVRVLRTSLQLACARVGAFWDDKFHHFFGRSSVLAFFLFSTQMVKTRITQRRDAVMKQPAFSRCHRFFNPTHTSFVAWWIGFCRHSELWRACGRALLHKVLAPRPCAVSRGEPRERGANSRQQHRESLIAEFGCRWEQPMRLSSIQRPDLPGDNFPQRQLSIQFNWCLPQPSGLPHPPWTDFQSSATPYVAKRVPTPNSTGSDSYLSTRS